MIRICDVGEDVEHCLRVLVENANGDIKKAERGIIYLDEVDKIGRKGENVSITRDVSGESVQQSLLKIVEGTISEVPPKGQRKNPNQECFKIDTSNILFIIGGSFEGIEKIIAKRLQGTRTMGFGANIKDTNKIDFNEYIHKIKVEDLRKFGMLPEFLGRFPIIATMDELDIKALRSILTKPKNALVKQYTELLKMDNVKLEFESNALDNIAKEAIKNKTGARGLRSIIDRILLKPMYNAPDIENINKIIVKNDLTCENKIREVS